MPNEDDFATLFEQSLVTELPQEGDIVRGKIVAINKEMVVIDFRHKQEGLIPTAEFRAPDGSISVKVGDDVEAFVESLENEEGLAILSREKAQAFKVWDRLEEAAESDGSIEGTVIGKVKGGLSVDIGVKAFLPASQIDLKGPGNLDRMLGKKYKFKILKLNKRKGNIIISRRALLERGRDSVRQEVLQNLQEGQVITGEVKNLTEYGAFVDLGGMDGLLHITDMSWGRLGHPSELLKVGQEVNVRILKVDPESGKVSLGLKQLGKDPWEGLETKLPIGSRHRGRVVNLADYGAFVELEPGVEGLVHISEMSWSRKVKQPSRIVSLGDTVEAVVLDIDVGARRISLGMKQLLENPWEAVFQKFPVGTKVRGPVRSITDFGLFVGLSGEVDGLVHISDLSWVRPVRPLGEIFPKHKEVEAIVLQMDRDSERISLGIKQLTEDPWPRVKKQYTIGSKHEGPVAWRSDKGVAIALEPGIEGFLSHDDLEPLGRGAQSGETLSVIVRSLDEKDRRISLGLVIE